MDFKKIIVSGLVAGLAAFIVGNLLYLNPLTASLYSASSASYCSKSMDLFGGLMPWLGLMWLGGMISTVFLAVIYSYTEKGLGGPAWRKGLFFGFLLWLVAGLPNAYNTWLLHSYPDAMILVETINGLIGGLVAGLVLAIVYEKMK
ncbi:MAG: hypothetical protein V1492_02290 [Candidatus Micrarchaeota archaeon]